MSRKYDALREFLATTRRDPVSMSFEEIDGLVGGLPDSAYKYREWWANSPSHVGARDGWISAGMRTGPVDMIARTVTFTRAGVKSPLRAASRTQGSRGRRTVAAPETIGEGEVAGLNTFLAFRGESGELRDRIREIESSVVGLLSADSAAAANRLGVNRNLLAGAVLVKRLAAQVDVVLHAAGILQALPHILQPDETVTAVSLGAGSTGRGYDLETDKQIAEFKFIGWKGSSEAARQDNLLIDVFNLATDADTTKRRVLYLTGVETPLRWLETSKRDTRDCLARRHRIPARFNARYGKEAYPRVCDYWAAVSDLVEVLDLNLMVPGLVGIADED